MAQGHYINNSVATRTLAPIITLKNLMKTSYEILENVIDGLVSKVTELFHYLNEYEIIFNENESVFKLLKSTHSHFWNDLYWLYWSFLTIRICNLMDKAETFGSKNLSFYLLKETILEYNLECSNQVGEIIKEIEEKILPFRTARKKAFAHFDLKILSSKEGLEVLQLDDFEFILSRFSTIINLVNGELTRDTFLFGIKSLEGAKRILAILTLGIETRNKLGNK